MLRQYFICEAIFPERDVLLKHSPFCVHPTKVGVNRIRDKYYIGTKKCSQSGTSVNTFYLEHGPTLLCLIVYLSYPSTVEPPLSGRSGFRKCP